MLLPYRTDAPVYYFPWATIGLIVVNVVAFLATFGLPAKEFQEYVLQYGVGLKPHQWLTRNFLHAGIFHLAGNMVFLWTFGLIVEGKVGPLVFLPLYLGMGIFQAAAEQALLSGSPGVGGSLGASAILFGLMAIALVWAPRNDVTVIGHIFMKGLHFDAPILAFCGLFILWEGFVVVLTGAALSSAALHATGALIGFAVGVAFLSLRWVDCEGWDLFSVLAGEEAKARRVRRR